MAIDKGKNFYVFSVSRAIRDIHSTENLGVISIYVDIDLLRNICSGIKTLKDERIVIIDKKDRIIYDSVEKNISSSLRDNPDLPDIIYDLNENSALKKLDKKGYVVFRNEIEGADWSLIRIMPEKQLFYNVYKANVWFMLIVLIFIAISFVLSFLIAYFVTSPLNKLIQKMNKVQDGDLNVSFKVNSTDEFGYLGKCFNSMIRKINDMVNEIYVSNFRKKQAELNALQAQINPHFLYNTLESIRMTAELNDDEDAASMIHILSKLFRYSVNTIDKLVYVRDEIENLKNYIKLQNYRFSNQFILNLNMDESLYVYPMIKLILQPIVENSIIHGFDNKKGNDCTITITASKTEKGIKFELSDNGQGMTDEQSALLNNSINDFIDSENKKPSIGLKNVNERIKLHYGDEYGLKIWSKAGVGTKIIVEIG